MPGSSASSGSPPLLLEDCTSELDIDGFLSSANTSVWVRAGLVRDESHESLVVDIVEDGGLGLGDHEWLDCTHRRFPRPRILTF